MKNKLPNPKRVIVDTDKYFNSWLRQPRGRGMWAFAPSRNPQDIKFISGSYAEAKAVAQRHFAYEIRIDVLP